MSANESLIYGGTYHIQNGFENWQGGYLDTCYGAAAPNKYQVSTSSSTDRANQGTGSWKIVSASGKADGTLVLYGDVFHLQNQYESNGGYLDTCFHADTPNKYQVSTSDSRDRASGSGKWKIMSATGKANGTPVLSNDVLHLQNQFNGNGGYLDTCFYADKPNKYKVSTSDSSNRASGSGQWRFVKATLSPSPSTFELKVPTNSQTGVEFPNTSSTQVSYKFTPSGTWKPKADIPDCTAAGLKGFPPETQTIYSEALKPYQENLKYPNNTTFALLAVNKTTGVVTEVGQETTIVLKAGEKLTFLVNDFTPNYDDNTGTLTVQCSIA